MLNKRHVVVEPRDCLGCSLRFAMQEKLHYLLLDARRAILANWLDFSFVGYFVPVISKAGSLTDSHFFESWGDPLGAYGEAP